MTSLGLFDAAGSSYTVHRAVADDICEIVKLLADDPLGAARETAPLEQYHQAFERIAADPQQYLLVVRADDQQTSSAAQLSSSARAKSAGQVFGTAQLSLIPYLSRGGNTRLHVEAVRIASAAQGKGLGSAFMEWIHQFGRDHGAQLVQLTSDNSRTDAHRFYQRLGYTASHTGFKRSL